MAVTDSFLSFYEHLLNTNHHEVLTNQKPVFLVTCIDQSEWNKTGGEWDVCAHTRVSEDLDTPED